MAICYTFHMVGLRRNNSWLLGFFLALVLALNSSNLAAQGNDDAAELEELLDSQGDETDVETEEEYALPVPAPAEEDSPVLNEADVDYVAPRETNEDLFLPVPSDQVGLPAISGVDERDDDAVPFYRAGELRYESNKDIPGAKPPITLHVGYGQRTFAAGSGVTEVQPGFGGGFHTRLLGGRPLGLPISLHADAAVMFTDVGTVSGLVEGEPREAVSVAETMYRFGLLAQLELSRRIILYGGVFYRLNEVRNSGGRSSNDNSIQGLNVAPLVGALAVREISFGLGAEWDFYVVPFGSLGIRGWYEPGLIVGSLSYSFDFVRPKRGAMNFEFD